MSSGLVSSTLENLSRALSHALTSEQIARKPGLMQSLDPRAKVLGIFVLVIAVAVVHKVAVLLGLFAGALVLALGSAIPLRTLILRVWLVVLAFTGVIALPALFLTPGDPLSPSSFVTRQGLHTAILLILRVEAAVTLTTTLVLTTPWAQILKALRLLAVPKEAVMMLGMAHRYIFLLTETATRMFESRESRRVGKLRGREKRHMVAQTAGVLMTKSIDLSQEVFLAMQSRGYRGDVFTVADTRMRPHDYIVILVFVAFAVLAVWWGR